MRLRAAMTKSATDIMQDVINAAVVDAIVAPYSNAQFDAYWTFS